MAGLLCEIYRPHQWHGCWFSLALSVSHHNESQTIMKSYPHNRFQSVPFGSTSSNSFTLSAGVPQGSVPGCVLCFFHFTFRLSVPSPTYNLHHQQYADDTQLFISVSHTDPTLSVTKLEYCLTDLYFWLPHNGLVWILQYLMLFFGRQQRLAFTFPPITSINIAGSVVNPY